VTGEMAIDDAVNRVLLGENKELEHDLLQID
jgi:hypothetical protein